MSWKTDHTHIMTKIFATELRADPGRLSHLENFRLHVEIAEGVAIFTTFRWQFVEILCRCKLHGFHRQFSARTAYDDREMIRRARGRSERKHLLFQKCEHSIVCQDRWRRLKQKCLVGRTATFGDEKQLVGVFTLRVDLNLCRH